MWPFTRLRTYSPGTPVHGNDINSLQDAVIRHVHGELQVPIPLTLARPGTDWSSDYGAWTAPTTGGMISIPVPLPGGTDILALTAWWNLNSYPIDVMNTGDRLYLTVNSRDHFTDAGWPQDAESEHIADDTIGDHNGDRIRYTWDIRENPVHLVADRLYLVSAYLGTAARRINGITATIARR